MARLHARTAARPATWASLNVSGRQIEPQFLRPRHCREKESRPSRRLTGFVSGSRRSPSSDLPYFQSDGWSRSRSWPLSQGRAVSSLRAPWRDRTRIAELAAHANTQLLRMCLLARFDDLLVAGGECRL